MLKSRLLFILFIFMVTPFAAYSEAPKDFINKDFIYKGKPIDSLCFYESENSGKLVSLENCGVTAIKDRSFYSEIDSDLVKQGFIGYNYQWKEDSTESQGSTYYKVIGKSNDSYIVYTVNNTGGSGSFSSINLVKRIGDQLKITTIATGDRCNNGIYDVIQKSNKLIYKVNLTAFDFLTLAKDNPHKIKAYDDLDACAACCKAAGVFERETGKNIEKEKLLFVDLNAYPDEEGSGVSLPSPTYQACFDNLMKTYKIKVKNKLTDTELKAFTEQFNRDCVKAKKNND